MSLATVRAHSPLGLPAAAPVRGTQSFVGVMAEVLKRPSLTGLEALWRWVFWVAVLLRPAPSLYVDLLRVVNGFQAGGFPRLGEVLVALFWELRVLLATQFGWLLAAVLLWMVVGALGRTALLRRMDPSLRPSVVNMALLSALRWIGWALAVGLWCGGLLGAVAHFVTSPQARGAEAEWIPFCAVAIAGTLILFVLWLGSSWVLLLMSIYAAQGKTLGDCWNRAVRRGPLAGKLAEINLVIGIVKIALLVLAMVFSACPLPFETVETQSFLLTWTAGVLLLYFLVSDYFHVVRVLAFVRMQKALVPLPAAARDAVVAS